jgi:pimeloyl-ACP methyl ester carboxylesterase
MIDPIFLGNGPAQMSIEAPIGGASSIALFVPGASGGAFTARFDPLVHALNSRGVGVARLSLYNSPEERDQRSMANMHADIHAALGHLTERGFATIFAIGKSFGGALLLTYPGDVFAGRVLWAPALGTAASQPNVATFSTMPMGSLPSLLEVTVDRDFFAHLAGSAAPTLIVQGTADTIVEPANSETLVWMLPQARMVTIDGADHSFGEPAHEHILIDKTVAFILEHEPSAAQK